MRILTKQEHEAQVETGEFLHRQKHLQKDCLCDELEHEMAKEDGRDCYEHCSECEVEK